MLRHRPAVENRRVAVSATVVLCALSLLAAPPIDAQDEPPQSTPPIVWELRTFDVDPESLNRRGHASRFYNDHLLPRMARDFEGYNGVWLTRDAPGTVHQDVVFDVWSDAATRQAERATRRALADYLLEETSLSRVVARVQRRGRHRSAVDELKSGHRRAGTVRWDLGISHGRPRVDMRYTVGAHGQGEVKFTLGGDGRFRVEFRPGRFTRTRLRATWLFDDQEYRVGANFAF